MADRRRYTGTKTLQTGWTLLLVAVAVTANLVLSTGTGRMILVGGIGGTWILGLVLLGWNDRRHWNQMVDASTFQREPGAHTADLQKIIRGRSVTVTTDVTGPLSQAHTRVRANLDGVDASFKIRISDAGSVDGSRGLTTGNETLDQRFVIEGSAANVKALLSTEVQSALMDVQTPGTFTVTADRVVYDIPFTRLSSDELDSAATAVALIADRIEKLVQR